MRPPLGIVGVDPVPGCGHEAETAVEVGLPKKGDEWFARGVGRADDGMHYCLADSLALIGRQNADRSQAERCRLSDPSAGAHNVANDLLVTHCHHRECGDPSAVAPQRSQQACLGRLHNAVANSKRGRSHGFHRADVFSNLTPDDHGAVGVARSLQSSRTRVSGLRGKCTPADDRIRPLPSRLATASARRQLSASGGNQAPDSSRPRWRIVQSARAQALRRTNALVGTPCPRRRCLWPRTPSLGRPPCARPPTPSRRQTRDRCQREALGDAWLEASAGAGSGTDLGVVVADYEPGPLLGGEIASGYGARASLPGGERHRPGEAVAVVIDGD